MRPPVVRGAACGPVGALSAGVGERSACRVRPGGCALPLVCERQREGRSPLIELPGRCSERAWGRASQALHFLRRWGARPDCALVLADPYWNETGNDKAWALLRPHHPVRMKIMCSPLDARLTATQAAALLKQVRRRP
jgi:hypothetical protein